MFCILPWQDACGWLDWPKYWETMTIPWALFDKDDQSKMFILYICHTSHNVCAYIRTAYLMLTAIVILLTSKVHLNYFNLFIWKWMRSWCELLPFLSYYCLKGVLAELILFYHFKGAYLNVIFIMWWMAELVLFYHFKGAYLNVIIMWMLGGLILFYHFKGAYLNVIIMWWSRWWRAHHPSVLGDHNGRSLCSDVLPDQSVVWKTGREDRQGVSRHHEKPDCSRSLHGWNWWVAFFLDLKKMMDVLLMSLLGTALLPVVLWVLFFLFFLVCMYLQVHQLLFPTSRIGLTCCALAWLFWCCRFCEGIGDGATANRPGGAPQRAGAAGSQSRGHGPHAGQGHPVRRGLPPCW